MATTRGVTKGRRLAPRWRKLLLVVHVATSVGLLGTDSAVLLLAIRGAAGADPGGVYPAAQSIGELLLVPLALLSLLSGITLGLVTTWGLVRHWWVLLKLVLTSAGTVLALVVLTPALSALAGAARAEMVIATADRLLLVRDTGAASVVLLITLALSIYKPFGRVNEKPASRVAVTPGAPHR